MTSADSLRDLAPPGWGLVCNHQCVRWRAQGVAEDHGGAAGSDDRRRFSAMFLRAWEALEFSHNTRLRHRRQILLYCTTLFLP